MLKITKFGGSSMADAGQFRKGDARRVQGGGDGILVAGKIADKTAIAFFITENIILFMSYFIFRNFFTDEFESS